MSGGYDGKIAGLYDLEETLGRGHYAVVKLARHVFTGEKVAVKVIDKIRLDEVSRAHLFQEVRCMKLVQHPNVVRLYEVIDTQTKLYLILELADGGDMYDYIMKHDTGLDEMAAKKYFRQIVHAISFCHRLHVVHRDLKPENVVFFEKLGMVKLTDFGFSNKFCPGQKLETSCGSLAYSAPEILLGDSYDAPAVDIWSLGVILYMLVVGRAPFQEANDSETLTRIMDCDFTIPEHVSKPCRDLIRKMLIRDPARRSTLEDIANDEWLMSESPEMDIADVLPLVSRQHLTEEDHAHIIHKMVAGTIASMDEILEALDKNEYNHITATYFLLAERKLRNHRMKQVDIAQKEVANLERSSTGSLNESSMLLNSTSPPGDHDSRMPLPPHSKDDTNSVNLHNKLSEVRMGGRIRTFSIVEEEDDEELQEEEEMKEGRVEDEEEGKRSRSGSRSESRSGSRRGSRASSTSSLKEKCLRDIKLDLSILHRIECVRRGSGSTQGSAATSPSAEEFLVPQPPFPPTSNLGLGRGRARSAASSPVTTPPNSLFGIVGNLSPTPPLQQQPMAPTRLTPQSSVSSSPTSQASSPSSPVLTLPPLAPSSPKTQAGFFSPKFKTLPSPNRRLHSVRSSPQLVLNEIFEEGESDGEGTSGVCPPPPYALALQTVASPSVMRRHRVTRPRTASGSSSEASDDDLREDVRKYRKRPSLTRQQSREAEDAVLGELEHVEEVEGRPPTPPNNSSSTEIPKLTLSPAPSLPGSPPPHPAPSQGTPSRGGSGRPLSATCEDERKARLLSEKSSSGGSTENVLDIDTTLRESRSLNCIVGTGDGSGCAEPPLHPPPLEQSSSSFDETTVKNSSATSCPFPGNITVSSDNITTIYIEDHHFGGNTPPEAPSSKANSEEDDRVVIHIVDGPTMHPNGGPVSPHGPSVGSDPNHYFTLPITSAHRPPLNASEIFLGLDDPPRPRPRYGGQRPPRCPSSGPTAKKVPPSSASSRFSLSCLSSSSSNPALPNPPSPWPFGLHLRHTEAAPPVVSQPPSTTPLSSTLSKSASHLEVLRGGGPLAPHKLRTSATNGSLAAGRGGYLTDINQNAGAVNGGRKNRSEKSSLALHGTSKCCAIS